MMRNLMLVLAYDGTDFHGWQFQPGIRTVQECVEIALRRTVRHRVAIVGCSRTDAGVHAAGYVANLYTTSPAPNLSIARSLATRLPPDLALVHLAEVPLTFNATQSAISKLYRYRIHNTSQRPVDRFTHRQVYHPRRSLEIGRMQEAATHLVGRHDFTSFASAGNKRQSNVRTIRRVELYRSGPEIRIDVEGDGFLYKQVRNMVGMLCEIGRGHWTPDRAKRILAARDRSQAGPTAPAQGLCLQWVRYDIPRLPPPSDELLDRARRTEHPSGPERARVDSLPLADAPRASDQSEPRL